MKKVINVVFYKFYSAQEDVKEREQAVLFYDDGTVESVSVEEAVQATHKIAIEENIKSKEELKEKFNKDRIYVMSGEELERRFQEFVVKQPKKQYTAEDYKMTQEAFDDYIAQGFEPGTEDFNSAVILDGTGVVPGREYTKTKTPSTPQRPRTEEEERRELGQRLTEVLRKRSEQLQNQETVTPVVTSPAVVTPAVTSPAVITPRVTSPAVITPKIRIKSPGDAPVVTPVVTPRTTTPVVTPVVTPRTTTPAVTPVVTPRTTTPVVTPVVTPRTTTPAVTPVVTPSTTTPVVTPVVTPVIIPVVTPRTTTPVVTPVVTPRTTTPVVTPVVTPRTTTPVVTPVVTPRTTTPAVTPVATPTVTPPKKKNIFQRLADKLKKNKIVRNIAIGATALAIALFGYSCGARQSQQGQIIDPPAISATMLEETSDEYIALINKTTNETQKEAMIHASYLMDDFNTRFAEAYTEQGKDVKAALTWDEMMALNLAYNDYTKEEIIAMFNGAEIDAQEFSNAYRNGTLQLMGAYVIADRDEPVGSYKFLRDEEQQAFVKKYEDMFYTCKEAETEEARIAAVNAFYAELYKDFPISNEIREEGISHAEGRRQLQPYKLAVTPIVAATEMMFQNLEIDHTLSDKAIAYFNDMGLCNLADAEFEKAMYILLAADTDEKNPTYADFKMTKIDELVYEGSYGIADAERDLSQLDEFQYWVNGGYLGDTWKYVPGTTTTNTWTETTTNTWTETTTTTTDDREEAVEQAGEEAVQEAEDQVDQQIEEENEQARQEAEEEAARREDELQDEADREREELEEEVQQDEEDLQEDIEDANDEIEQGGTVNEDDFGDHNVDFDDEHSNENGDLDDSVTDITTDGDGAVDSDEPLPDPNELEDDYTDSSAGTISYSQDATSSYEEDVQNTSGQIIYEYEEPITNEQLVDAYIRSLEQGSNTNADEKGYSK